MATITTKDSTQIYYKDRGKGQPIVFSHGCPLTSDDWDAQMLFFGQYGYRVIAHDRRARGRSTQTSDVNPDLLAFFKGTAANAAAAVL
jgi:non-heme chloroperoxidase